MTPVRDSELAHNFQNDEIAQLAFAAAQKSFTESMRRNPDAMFALNLQKREVESQLSNFGNDSMIARQFQEQEYLEQEQLDANIAKSLEDDESRSNINGRRITTENRLVQPSMVSRSDTTIARQLNDDEIATSAFVAAQKPFTESIMRNPDAVLALKLQRLEVGNSQPQQSDHESSRLAMQLQEQENLEQQLHDANFAQELSENGDGGTVTVMGGRAPIRNEEIRRVNPTAPSLSRLNRQDRRQHRHSRFQRREVPLVRDDSQSDNDENVEDYETLWEIQEENGDVSNRGLSKNQIDRIPHHKYRSQPGTTQSEKDSCRICLSNYHNGDTVKTLTCCHSYHRKCIDPWLKRQSECPVCRQQIRIP